MAQFGNHTRQDGSFQRGNIWTVTRIFFNITVFYFIVTLQCVHSLKNVAYSSDLSTCCQVLLFFCANRHSIVVCCSMTSRFYVCLCDKISTMDALCFCFAQNCPRLFQGVKM